MLLHTLNKSPFSHHAIRTCAQLCDAEDAVILLEDGVYAVSYPELGDLFNSGTKIYAIEADILSRGLSEQYARNTAIKTISYEEFVALCVQYPKQKSW